jgi:hypothetical protein
MWIPLDCSRRIAAGNAAIDFEAAVHGGGPVEARQLRCAYTVDAWEGEDSGHRYKRVVKTSPMKQEFKGRMILVRLCLRRFGGTGQDRHDRISVSWINRGAAPTTVLSSSTSLVMTVHAPSVTREPIRIAPIATAPAPNSTSSPMTGDPLHVPSRRRLFPMVTPWRKIQRAPILVSLCTTNPCP